MEKNAIKKYVKLQENNISPSIFANAFVNSIAICNQQYCGSKPSLDQLKENINSVYFRMTNKMFKEIDDIHLSDPNPLCLNKKYLIYGNMKINNLINKIPGYVLYIQLRIWVF